MTESVSWGTRFADGAMQMTGAGRPAFVACLKDRDQQRQLFHSDLYSAAKAFVEGDFDISGDIVSAIRVLRRRIHPGTGGKIREFLSRVSPAWLEAFLQSRTRAARNIRFHYDRSNEFYQMFLDSRLLYSAALFKDPGWSLEQAQLAKLDSICRKLDLRSGERFLDVGCGWGALIVYAAETYGAETSGCTLSHNQYEFASSLIASHGIAKRASVAEVDYRGLRGHFRKISSIGMFEHVGRRRLGQYFRTIHGLLEEGGLFLNSGITRPQHVGDDAETRFLRAQVFPGGELAHLSDIIREAENAGFSILQTESVRLHYARTCREWITRLQDHSDLCMSLTDNRTWRTWLLYLGASVVNFEDGETDAQQILMQRN